jgi:pimeloyl-ACP methyl ester carboxylesterase
MATAVPTPSLESKLLPGAGVQLHAVLAGDAGGAPVVLLHGFPEFWYGWRHQIGPLAAAGFRVIAPDQRGYNGSDKPPRVADYALDRTAADVLALLDALGLERAALVGHDWGGIVGWVLAAARPDRVARLAVLNAPHPEAMRRALAGGDFAQLLRSWYAFAMQLPRLPERALGRDGGRPLAESLKRTSRPGTFTDAELAVYRQAWGQPGALSGMVNWYRAAFRYPGRGRAGRVRVPVLVIWGDRDEFIRPKLAADSLKFCADGRLVRLPRATHWVQHEEAGRVNELLAEFLSPRAGA